MKLKKEHFWNPKKPEDQTPTQKAFAGGCGAVALLILILIMVKACTPGEPQGASNAAESEPAENTSLSVEQQKTAPSPNASEFAAGASSPPAGMENNCQFVECSSGSQVKILSSKNDPTYGCETEELLDYFSFVMGYLAMQKMITGSMPNISPGTGEPELSGESADMLATLRTRAKVDTFDEAYTRCGKMPNGRRMMVINFPADGARMGMWVNDEKTNRNYWVLKSAADRVQP